MLGSGFPLFDHDVAVRQMDNRVHHGFHRDIGILAGTAGVEAQLRENLPGAHGAVVLITGETIFLP